MLRRHAADFVKDRWVHLVAAQLDQLHERVAGRKTK
jgi:hypothetical protein